MPAPTDGTAAPLRATPTSQAVDVHRLGDALVCRLQAALARHGITLPSLRADYPLGDKPLIMLGRVNQETVEALASLLDSIDSDAS
jgi:hypothetical protein